MEQKQVVLISGDNRNVILDLHDKPPQENIFDEDFMNYQFVFSDQEYGFQLKNIDEEKIQSMSVFINDEEQYYYSEKGMFFFAQQRRGKLKPFRNRFGFAEISFEICYGDGRVEFCYSDYLSILVHKDSELQAVNTMIDYVYRNQEHLLITGDIGNTVPGDVKKGSVINLETRVSLAQDILKVYNDSYGYFSANSRFKTRTVDMVDDTNKLQSMSPKTLQYITTHPSYLQLGLVNTGVRIGKRHFIPQKTMMEKREYSYDIYENQIVVGFLEKMLEDINFMITAVKNLIKKYAGFFDVSGEYIHSSYFIFQHTNEALNKNLTRMNSIKKELEIMWNLYRRTLNIEGAKINQMPKPSALFLSVAQYNNIYNYMSRWFDFGIYNFAQERFMLSFLNGSVLYEIFSLAKLMEAVSLQGFVLVNEYRYSYRIMNAALYRNKLCNNTFIYARNEERLTIYYQPMITNSRYKSANGINVYRNNSYAYEKSYGTYYYAPDYLIKYEHNGVERYLILDAKFGNRYFVIEQASKLVFKYLFSISPRENQTILGLCILYGKSNEQNNKESIYDETYSTKKIYPVFDMAPISPDIGNDKHMKFLSDAIQYLWKSL